MRNIYSAMLATGSIGAFLSCVSLGGQWEPRDPSAGAAGTYELHGTGESYGFGDAAVDLSRDPVIGRRVGPPDRSLCVRAAEAELARRGR